MLAAYLRNELKEVFVLALMRPRVFVAGIVCGLVGLCLGLFFPEPFGVLVGVPCSAPIIWGGVMGAYQEKPYYRWEVPVGSFALGTSMVLPIVVSAISVMEYYGINI